MSNIQFDHKSASTHYVYYAGSHLNLPVVTISQTTFLIIAVVQFP